MCLKQNDVEEKKVSVCPKEKRILYAIKDLCCLILQF